MMSEGVMDVDESDSEDEDGVDGWSDIGPCGSTKAWSLAVGWRSCIIKEARCHEITYHDDMSYISSHLSYSRFCWVLATSQLRTNLSPTCMPFCICYVAYIDIARRLKLLRAPISPPYRQLWLWLDPHFYLCYSIDHRNMGALLSIPVLAGGLGSLGSTLCTGCTVFMGRSPPQLIWTYDYSLTR
jgi:hypothetical protein